MNNIMDEEKLLKSIKRYRIIIGILVSTLLVVIGYTHGLKLDVDNLNDKIENLDNEINLVRYSYIRNINEWIWKHQVE